MSLKISCDLFRMIRNCDSSKVIIFSYRFQTQRCRLLCMLKYAHCTVYVRMVFGRSKSLIIIVKRMVKPKLIVFCLGLFHFVRLFDFRGLKLWFGEHNVHNFVKIKISTKSFLHRINFTIDNTTILTRNWISFCCNYS